MLQEVKLNRRKRRRKQLAINNKLKRKLIPNNDFGICCYCKNTFNAKELTIEHKTPICLGGTSEIENIDLACAPCNQLKGREAWFYKRNLLKGKISHERQNS